MKKKTHNIKRPRLCTICGETDEQNFKPDRSGKCNACLAKENRDKALIRYHKNKNKTKVPVAERIARYFADKEYDNGTI